MLLEEWASEGALSRALAQYRVLSRRRKLAPIRIVMGHFESFAARDTAAHHGELEAAVRPSALPINRRRLVIIM